MRAPEPVEEFVNDPNGGEPVKVLRRPPGKVVTAEQEGCPFVIEARVVQEDGGPAQVVELLIRGPAGAPDVPITRSDLQRISLTRIATATSRDLPAAAAAATLKREAASYPTAAAELEGDETAAYLLGIAGPNLFREPEKYVRSSEPDSKQKRRMGRPSKITPEFLQAVAGFARDAHRLGQPINAYVAVQIEGDPKQQPRPATVRWYLAQAREQGFLKPGELRGKKK